MGVFPVLQEVSQAHTRLRKILRAIWRKGKVVQQRRFAGVWVPKEARSTRFNYLKGKERQDLVRKEVGAMVGLRQQSAWIRWEEGGLLGTVHDWQMRVNLGQQLRFTHNITETSLWLDIVLFSGNSKQVVMLELTVPWEESTVHDH